MRAIRQIRKEAAVWRERQGGGLQGGDFFRFEVHLRLQWGGKCRLCCLFQSLKFGRNKHIRMISARWLHRPFRSQQSRSPRRNRGFSALLSTVMLWTTGVLFLPGPSRLHKERGSEEEEHLEPHHLSRLSAPSLFTVSEVASLINSSGLFLPVVTVRQFTQANHYTLCSPDSQKQWPLLRSWWWIFKALTPGCWIWIWT